MPVRRCLAHVSEDGSEQSVEAHLEGTAALAAGFAAPFGAGAQGRFVGLAHDIGKYSDAFQRRLLENGRKVDHATAGAVECARLGAEWAAFCVAGHHGGLPDGGSILDDAGCSTLIGRLKRGLSGGIPDYSAWPGGLPPSTPPALWGRDPLTDSFFVRMLYSCLVDGDYLDTEAFLRAAPPPRSGHDPLPVLLERLEGHISGWWPPKTDLNRRRCQILRACLDGGDRPRGLYTLTVPTGGGKTVASLAFALRHAIANGLDRVIYIIPYTSIIEQNAAVFRDILGEGNVVEHHSGVNWDPEDETAPAQYRQTLAAENFDAPVVVTTAVQFFESLYASRPSQCRKLHNCSNSVLIFDEAQMLPLEHLRPCVAAIAQLVAHFRSTAVLCTATQPALEAQFRAFAPALPIQELCPGTSDLYEHFRRVTFARAGRLSREALAERLAAQPQALCIVNSRKSAGALYRLLPPEHRFHLSTLMFPVHRRAVLDQVRRRLKNGLPCRVVSTSLIEAGVDVDFPAVWREEAGLDSILQAAAPLPPQHRRHPGGPVRRGRPRPAGDGPPLLFVPAGPVRPCPGPVWGPGRLSAGVGCGTDAFPLRIRALPPDRQPHKDGLHPPGRGRPADGPAPRRGALPGPVPPVGPVRRQPLRPALPGPAVRRRPGGAGGRHGSDGQPVSLQPGDRPLPGRRFWKRAVCLKGPFFGTFLAVFCDHPIERSEPHVHSCRGLG